jgi:hypothetical protein
MMYEFVQAMRCLNMQHEDGSVVMTTTLFCNGLISINDMQGDKAADNVKDAKDTAVNKADETVQQAK